MTMTRALSLPLLALLLLPSSCFSFTASTHQVSKRASSTTLNLLPSQAKELEEYVKNHLHTEYKSAESATTTTTTAQIDTENDTKEDNKDAPSTPVLTPLNAARSFISRIFHQDDEVLVYPITGFRWVGNSVVPTKASVACVLHRQDENEELYGWFSPTTTNNDDDDDHN